MRKSILSLLGLWAVLAVGHSTAGDLRNDRRWLPDACILTLDVERALQVDVLEEEADAARWNRFYRLGIDAIDSQNLEQARASFCQALEAAGSFGPRDFRFAETLDELGLVAFMDEDYATSEAMQGAATAEILLALGPPPRDLAAAAEKEYKSSVATYMVRLGWIFERQGRPREIDALMTEPYRILERGYVPLDSVLPRLDWLIAQYLLAEDFAAADWLTALRDEVRYRFE